MAFAVIWSPSEGGPLTVVDVSMGPHGMGIRVFQVHMPARQRISSQGFAGFCLEPWSGSQHVLEFGTACT
jgi:hypothetical protein